jgi:hypothetical protein
MADGDLAASECGALGRFHVRSESITGEDPGHRRQVGV